MIHIEEIDQQEVFAGDHFDIQSLHQPQGRDIEVIADHEYRLHSSTIALSQGFDEFTVRVGSMSVQPLFELVDDDDDLFLHHPVHVAAR